MIASIFPPKVFQHGMAKEPPSDYLAAAQKKWSREPNIVSGRHSKGFVRLISAMPSCSFLSGIVTPSRPCRRALLGATAVEITIFAWAALKLFLPVR